VSDALARVRFRYFPVLDDEDAAAAQAALERWTEPAGARP
jgi:hypothetical protein